MNLKVLTLKTDPETGLLDDRPLQAFQAAHEVTHVIDHFYLCGGTPTLALLLTWRPRADGRQGPPAHESDRRGPMTEATAPAMSPESRVLYEALRRWRADRATRDHVPRQTILPNSTFVRMCETRPRTKAELLDLPGIGEAKLAAYGDELLALLQQFVLPGAIPATPDPAREVARSTGEPGDPPTRGLTEGEGPA
jgi:hypothetical protein